MPKRNKLGILLLSSLLITVSLLLLIFPQFKSQAEDSMPPELVAFALSSHEINSDTEGNEIFAYFRVKDASGIDMKDGTLRPEAYDEETNANTQNVHLDLQLLTEGCDVLGDTIDTEGLEGCGDKYDGIYRAGISLPYGSTAGVWRVQNIHLQGTSTNYEVPAGYIDYSFTDLEALYGEGSATIENKGVKEDTTPPEIVAYTFGRDLIEGKYTINTEDNDETLVLTVHIKDDISGIGNPSLTFINAHSGNRASFGMSLKEANTCNSEDMWVGDEGNCGDKNDGIYVSLPVKMPRWSPIGDWVWDGSISDNIGNYTSTPPLVPMLFHNSAIHEDIEGPTVKSFTFDKSKFDTSEGEDIITFTIELEDDLSGIDIDQYKTNIGISPVFDWGNSNINSGEFVLLPGGTLTKGTFEAKIIIPKDSKPGFWSLTGLGVYDNAGNQTHPDMEDLLGDAGIYFANTSLADSVEIATAWYLEGEGVPSLEYSEDQYGNKMYYGWPSITIKFQEGTVVTKKGGGNFGIHRMVSKSYFTEKYKTLSELLTEANSKLETDVKECAISEGCVAEQLNDNNLVGKPLNVGKVGLPGLGLTFSKPVTVILAVDKEYLGQTLTIQSFDGTSWVNQATCLVKDTPPNENAAGCGFDEELGEMVCGKNVSYPGCSFETDHASFFTANVLGAEDKAGVPKTGLGGFRNNGLEKYIGWIK